MKPDKDLKNQLERLEIFLRDSLKDDKLSQILKYLIKSIVEYKDNDLETSINKFGKVIALSHGHLFRILNKITTKEIPDPVYPKWLGPVFYFESLYYNLFIDLNIEDIELIFETRTIYKKRSNYEHNENPIKKHHPPKQEFLNISVSCIKLFLMLRFIRKLLVQIGNQFSIDIQKGNAFRQNKREYFTLRVQKINIGLEKLFSKLFEKPDSEIIKLFIGKLFKPDIKTLILEKKLIKKDYIKNSAFLLKYYPKILFSDYRIESVLDSKDVIEFRPDGPHLIDFQLGKWLYIPTSAYNIYNVIKCYKESILIQSPSGSGKTVISRFIANMFIKAKYDVFYFDILNIEKNDFDAVLNHALNRLMKICQNNQILFIFENIHDLKENINVNIIKKLNRIKKNCLCLFTQRLFSSDDKKKPEEIIKFDENRIVMINQNSESYDNLIKGIIDKNNDNETRKAQLKSIKIKNLWVYAIVLKIFKQNLEFQIETSVFETLTDTELIADELTKIFEKLLKSKQNNIGEFDFEDYKNHIKYILAVISIFSELELWVEKSFLTNLIFIVDNSAIGQLNKNININPEIFAKCVNFLVRTFEIEKKSIKYNKIFNEIEFKIPHSQMATIYKNCFLKNLDDIFQGLILEIKNRYILEGRHFGTYLFKRSIYLNRTLRDGNLQLYMERYFSSSNLIQKNDDSDGNFLKLKEQMKNRNTIEIYRFFFAISSFKEKLPKRFIKDFQMDHKLVQTQKHLHSKDFQISDKLFYSLFSDPTVLTSSNWKNRILRNDIGYLYNILNLIKEEMGEKVLLTFFREFTEEVTEKFQEVNGIYNIYSIILLFRLPLKKWKDIFQVLKQLSINITPKYDDLNEIRHIEYKIFDNYCTSHYIHKIFKKMIKNFVLNGSLTDHSKLLQNKKYNRLIAFAKIYIGFLKKTLTKIPKKPDSLILNEFFNNKFLNSDANTILKFLINLNGYSRTLTKYVLKNSIDLIKNNFNKANLDTKLNTFDFLFNKINDKNFLSNLILSDLIWFKKLFINLDLKDLIRVQERCKYDIFRRNFLINIRGEINQFFNEIITEKINNYHEKLTNKINIYKLLYSFNLTTDYKKIVSDLFINALDKSLYNPNIDFYINLLKNSDFDSKSVRITNWSIEVLIKDNRFKNLIEICSKEEIINFSRILKETSRIWFKKFINTYENLLSGKFGNEISYNINLNKDDYQKYLKLKENLKGFNFKGFNIICNNTIKREYFLRLDFNYRVVYGAESFLRFLDGIFSNYNERYLNTELAEIIERTNNFNLINFIIILKAFNNQFLQDFLSKFEDIISQKLNNLSNFIIEIIFLIKIYHFNIKTLKDIDTILHNKTNLYGNVKKWLEELDLITIRWLINKFPNIFLEYGSQPSVDKIIENSSLLQISLGIINKNVYIKRGLKRNISFNTYHKIFEIEIEIFDNIISKIELFIPPKKREYLKFEKMNNLQNKVIMSDFRPFSSNLKLKIKGAGLDEILIYYDSLNTWREKFKEGNPNDIEAFFNSEEFSRKLIKYDFNMITRLLDRFKITNNYFFKKLWTLNQEYFLSLDFLNLLKDQPFFKIFSFYLSFPSNQERFSSEIIAFLKEQLKTVSFFTLINSMRDPLTQEQCSFFISTFHNEINQIITNSSRYEILNQFKYGYIKRKYPDYLDEIEEQFPAITDKFKEKYFFEE